MSGLEAVNRPGVWNVVPLSALSTTMVLTAMCVPLSTRVGVYLDHRAGTLSLYSVSDTMTLLHRVQTPFTEPLYPGFFVDRSVKIMTSTQ